MHTNGTHLAWSNSLDAGHAAALIGITDADITTTAPVPGAKLALTSLRDGEANSSVLTRDLGAHRDLNRVAEWGHNPRRLHVVIKTGEGFAVLGRLDPDTARTVAISCARRLAAAGDWGHSSLTDYLTGLKAGSLLCERLLEALRCNQQVAQARELRADALRRLDAVVTVTSGGYPQPGTVTVDDLAQATDLAFLQMVRASAVLYAGDQASFTGRLFRFLGKPSGSGFDEAYATFWSHSAMRRDLVENEAINWANCAALDEEPERVVALMTDPIGVAVESSAFASAIGVGALLPLTIAHVADLVGNLPEKWVTTGREDYFAAGAITMAERGTNAETIATVLRVMNPVWKMPVMMLDTVSDAAKSRLVAAFRHLAAQ